ncbi:MAG: dihydrodipicolinate synthase family protein, partial [Bacteroidales bacterium]|nr:dihydrodipicolinate synthase family protein [Candidatus Cryptobacteroides aphodequi]
EQADTMIAAAAELDDDLQPLYKACFVESNPIPAKAALAIKGLCTATMRLPLVAASLSTVKLMESILL